MEARMVAARNAKKALRVMSKHLLSGRDARRTAIGGTKRLFDVDHPLPTLPAILFRLMQLLNEPRTTAGQLADVVVADPALLIRIIPMLSARFSGLLPGNPLRQAIAFVSRSRLS